MESHYPFTLPPLPFAYDALLPELDEKTMHFHHDKHFATYVDKLNELLAKYPAYQDWPLEKLVQDWPELPEDIRQGVRNNAGGVYNHDLYFKTLHSTPVTAPGAALQGAIGTEAGHEGSRSGAVRLRMGLAGQRRSGTAFRPQDAQPGHASAPDATAGLRRVGARLLPPLSEPPGGLFRGLVASGGLAHNLPGL